MSLIVTVSLNGSPQVTVKDNTVGAWKSATTGPDVGAGGTVGAGVGVAVGSVVGVGVGGTEVAVGGAGVGVAVGRAVAVGGAVVGGGGCGWGVEVGAGTAVGVGVGWASTRLSGSGVGAAAGTAATVGGGTGTVGKNCGDGCAVASTTGAAPAMIVVSRRKGLSSISRTAATTTQPTATAATLDRMAPDVVVSSISVSTGNPSSFQTV